MNKIRVALSSSILLMCVTGLASSVSAGSLYAVRDGSSGSPDQLIRIDIDTDTPAITVIGDLGVPYDFGGLAYDPNSDVMYMINGRTNKDLYTVNRFTAATTFIGTHGVDDLFGLAFDSTNNVLYASQFAAPFGLYSLGTTDGSANLIGNTSGTRIDALTYDSLSDRLVGMSVDGGDLLEVDRTDASTTLIFDGLFVNNSGLAYDPDKNLFWDIALDGNLYSYDPSNGFARTTQLSGLGSHDGLTYVSDVQAVPVPAAAWMGLTMLGSLSVTQLIRRRLAA